jgi:hypothetical protein
MAAPQVARDFAAHVAAAVAVEEHVGILREHDGSASRLIRAVSTGADGGAHELADERLGVGVLMVGERDLRPGVMQILPS